MNLENLTNGKIRRVNVFKSIVYYEIYITITSKIIVYFLVEEI